MTGQFGAVFWLILSVVLFLLEGMTVQLVSLWFAVGGLFAMGASFLGASFQVQIAVFLVFSILFLVVSRPWVRKWMATEKTKTNSDRVIGEIALVTEEIDNLHQTGRVTVLGLSWMARNLQGEQHIPAEAEVIVRRIEGVTLLVEPITNSQETREE